MERKIIKTHREHIRISGPDRYQIEMVGYVKIYNKPVGLWERIKKYLGYQLVPYGSIIEIYSEDHSMIHTSFGDKFYNMLQDKAEQMINELIA